MYHAKFAIELIEAARTAEQYGLRNDVENCNWSENQMNILYQDIATYTAARMRKVAEYENALQGYHDSAIQHRERIADCTAALELMKAE